jgi:hypothetical protein
MNSKFTNRNIFLIFFYLSFIDFFLFTILRTFIEFNFTDPNVYKILRSDFNWFQYSIYFLLSLTVFLFMRMLVLVCHKDIFRIYISRKTVVMLALLLLTCSIFIFFEQKIYKIRYSSGSITSLAGMINVLFRFLIFSLFFIYQLNRDKINFKIYILILVSSILVIDGLGGFYTFFSLLLFEYYRFNFKGKFLYFIVLLVPVILVLEFSFQMVFNYGSVGDNFLFSESFDIKYYAIDLVLPRISIQGEQTFSYISQDLDISSYTYLLKIIPELFKNILKVIFYNGENLYYPKSVAQSIAFDIRGIDSRGGSSPGFVLSSVSLFPFTLPLLILISYLIKQFCYRINIKINIIQIVCLGWILKGVSANLLDMLLVITPSFFLLIIIIISCNVYLKDKQN